MPTYANFVNLMWSLMAPERSWEGSGWAWELQSRLWGPPGGSRGKGFGPWRAPGGAQNTKNAILEPLSFFPKRSRAYIYSGFSVFLKKHVFFKFGSDGFSRAAREGAFGPSEISKEALGKADQVQGGPFWGVLDRQKFARAQILMEKVGGF